MRSPQLLTSYMVSGDFLWGMADESYCPSTSPPKSVCGWIIGVGLGSVINPLLQRVETLGERWAWVIATSLGLFFYLVPTFLLKMFCLILFMLYLCASAVDNICAWVPYFQWNLLSLLCENGDKFCKWLCCWPR